VLIKEAIHKRRLQAEEEVCPVRTKGEGRFLQMRASALFGAKNFGFFEFMVFSTDRGEEGSIFRNFVWTSFMSAPTNEKFI